jgi:hypothetical protein
VGNCFGKSARRLKVHESILAKNNGPVKYILPKVALTTRPPQGHVAPEADCLWDFSHAIPSTPGQFLWELAHMRLELCPDMSVESASL